MNGKVKVGIVGVSGYTGLELVKMLVSHPNFELVYASNTEGETTLAKLHPSLLGVIDLSVQRADSKEAAKACELVFLALPHKAAMSTAKELLALGVKVVDLSADYRTSQESYEANYCPHEDIDNLAHAVYSIPELHGDIAKNARLVANPGCHVTATLLALVPFLPHIDLSQPIFVDSKTGVSGAGKSPSAGTHFVAVNENLNHYNIIKHRHAAEIMEHASKLYGQKVDITFIPTLIPMSRGMMATVFATLKEDIEPQSILKKYYDGKPFVRVRDELPHTKAVSGTNYADLHAAKNKNALVSVCAIDNLMRGASSQAVVNANIMFGLSEDAGVPKIAYAP
jgi:N-acetyl-gamma-glutamyl-phosphate reductase